MDTRHYIGGYYIICKYGVTCSEHCPAVVSSVCDLIILFMVYILVRNKLSAKQ